MPRPRGQQESCCPPPRPSPLPDLIVWSQQGSFLCLWVPSSHQAPVPSSGSQFLRLCFPPLSFFLSAHISAFSFLLPRPPPHPSTTFKPLALGPQVSLPRAHLLCVHPRPSFLPAHPGDLPASNPGSGPPVAVARLAGGAVALPAGQHLHQVLAVQEHRVWRCAQHLAAALLRAQVAPTAPLSPRAKDRVLYI